MQEQELIKVLLRLGDLPGRPIFVVGGAVRDLLIGECPKGWDLDLVVEGDAISLAEQVFQEVGGVLKKFPDFLTAKIIKPDRFVGVAEIDFATARREVYEQPGALPRVTPASLEDDLARRDFSVNAMALRLSEYASREWSGLIDLAGGFEDLQARHIKVLHARSFIDDPTRIFRACRYAARLRGEFEPQTERLLKEALADGALESVSTARKLNELKKICLERSPERVFEILFEQGVLARWPGFERQTGEVVLQAAQELSALKSKGLSQDYYGTMFKVCCGELNDAKRDAFLHGASLGKREIKSIQALLGEKVCAATCEDASDEALVLAILRVPSGDERETMLAEVKRRSLVQA